MKNDFRLCGHLGKDAVFVEFGDKTVCNFSIAETVYLGKDKPKISQWWNCSMWLTTPKVAFQKDMLKKGAKVFLSGFLFQENVDQAGVKNTYYKVQVRELEHGGGSEKQPDSNVSEKMPETYTKPNMPVPEEPIGEGSDDLPF
jgi:single-stranded DNA-binding protein